MTARDRMWEHWTSLCQRREISMQSTLIDPIKDSRTGPIPFGPIAKERQLWYVVWLWGAYAQDRVAPIT